MTDLEIDKALALAIGWTRTFQSTQGICVYSGNYQDRVKSNGRWYFGVRLFSHKDWNIVGPIAERYNVFPIGGIRYSTSGDRWWFINSVCYAETPQKSIALAIIHKAKND